MTVVAIGAGDDATTSGDTGVTDGVTDTGVLVAGAIGAFGALGAGTAARVAVGAESVPAAMSAKRVPTRACRASPAPFVASCGAGTVTRPAPSTIAAAARRQTAFMTGDEAIIARPVR